MIDVFESLKDYFSARDDVAFVLLFGSRARGRPRDDSDWDIAVYFKEEDGTLDLENPGRDFPSERQLWNDAERIAGAAVDLVILNRAPATIAAAALYEGSLLACADRRLYERYLLAATLLAEDEREFARDYDRIKARSASLSEIDRDRLLRIIGFIESELADSPSFDEISLSAYLGDSAFRRNLERWIENLVNASIDIAKILAASNRMPVPQTYGETLLRLSTLPGFDAADCESMAIFSRLRNLLAHEYLDIRFPLIDNFVRTAPAIYRRLAETTRLVIAPAP
jgi:predicted nucleotidyltransferase/uncharacterized protein YutE (UPF0331/DUF86 family)